MPSSHAHLYDTSSPNLLEHVLSFLADDCRIADYRGHYHEVNVLQASIRGDVSCVQELLGDESNVRWVSDSGFSHMAWCTMCSSELMESLHYLNLPKNFHPRMEASVVVIRRLCSDHDASLEAHVRRFPHGWFRLLLPYHI